MAWHGVAWPSAEARCREEAGSRSFLRTRLERSLQVFPIRRRACLAFVSLVLLGLVLSIVDHQRVGIPLRITGAIYGREPLGLIEAVQDLSANVEDSKGKPMTDDDPCEHYPYLKLLGVSHSNLANKGPDKGPEGIIWRALDMGRGAGDDRNRQVDLHMHATGDDYSPFSSRLNGMQGKYAEINVNSGSKVSLKLTTYDTLSGKQITLPRMAMTFFDLDQGKNGFSKESVTIKHFHAAALSNTSEVQKTSAPEGTKFQSSTYGTGADNPEDPLFMNKQQKDRCVTLFFQDTMEVDMVAVASMGDGPRFFTFAGRPSVPCAVTVQTGFKAPLDDLLFEPPMQVPVRAHGHETFQKWFVKIGDKVKKGDKLFSTKTKDGKTHEYPATYPGTVSATQVSLKKGDQIKLRLDDKALVIINRTCFEPLKVKDGDQSVFGIAGHDFAKWHYKLGQMVDKGDPICDVENPHTKKVTSIMAPQSGMLNAIQDALKPGMPVEKVIDLNLANIGKCLPLPVKRTDHAIIAPKGCKFVRWEVGLHKSVVKGDVIAIVEDASDRKIPLKTKEGGIMLARQEHLKAGTCINATLQDNVIVVVGTFKPLKVKLGETPTNVPPGLKFVKWHKATAESVQQDDWLCDVMSPQGEVRTVTVPVAGIIARRQDGLRRGMLIDDALSDHNIATIRKLPAMPIKTGEEAVYASVGPWKFVEWYVQKGNVVNKGDPVAKIMKGANVYEDVAATKYGYVKMRQEHLRHGYTINEVTETSDLIVIGKFPQIEPSLWRSTVVVPSKECKLVKYNVMAGEKVDANGKIGTFDCPEPDGTMEIRNAHSGTVAQLQPLEPGQRVSDRELGAAIAQIDEGPPWWTYFLSVFGVVVCCTGCLFRVMKKEVPYSPVIVPEPVKPEGLRLDFQDDQIKQTVYAKWRPLGIKHNHVAPIISKDFTINSYAKTVLGVKEGWKLTRVGDEELNDCKDFEAVNSKLVKHMKDFPLWPLNLQFQKTYTSGKPVSVTFVERPIGIEFTNRAPIKVSKVYADSPAACAKVKEGWYLTKIGEADVTRGFNFSEVITLLKEGVCPLDDSGNDYETQAGTTY